MPCHCLIIRTIGRIGIISRYIIACARWSKKANWVGQYSVTCVVGVPWLPCLPELIKYGTYVYVHIYKLSTYRKTRKIPKNTHGGTG